MAGLQEYIDCLKRIRERAAEHQETMDEFGETGDWQHFQYVNDGFGSLAQRLDVVIHQMEKDETFDIVR